MLQNLLRWWKNVSIAKRLYFVVGIMAFLIIGELVTLRFAMKNLSAARAFVGAESLWSKAQKNAVFSLQRFGRTKSEKDYRAFLEDLRVSRGDHLARIELQKKDPNLAIVRQGFIEGKVHPEDIDPIIELLSRFYWISYLARSIDAWSKGDELILSLRNDGAAYHAAVLRGDSETSERVAAHIKDINEKLTPLEENFSYFLGEGSRWLEQMVLSILTIAVLMVESIGLTLAFITSRAISRGLNELNAVARRIGQGDFSQTVRVDAHDEIGQLGEVVNAMGQMLQRSYTDLENRVRERTTELARLATENAHLYEEAKMAVQTRDEFLSIASHEFKTPLTALKLQLYVTQKLVHPGAATTPAEEKLIRVLDLFNRQIDRLENLVEDLLDVAKIRSGKLTLRTEEVHLAALTREIVDRFEEQFKESKMTPILDLDEKVIGTWDKSRIEQVITNLISNALKYAPGKPIKFTVKKLDSFGYFSISDQGPGITRAKQNVIFERFERATSSRNISGLGLGLFIVKQIIEAHQGSIEVSSEVGHGSTFTVKLPYQLSHELEAQNAKRPMSAATLLNDLNS